MENKHTMADLLQMQSLPLDVKVRMTMQRIRGWIDEYGEDGVYISFSGGKDSTVLMDIIRNQMGIKNVPAVFVDVPTQYPELRDFAKTWSDVEIIKPKISFMEVCDKYGFPLISKEVAECVYGARRYLNKLIETGQITQTDADIPYKWQFQKLIGSGPFARKDAPNLREVAEILAISNRMHEANESTQNLMGWRISGKGNLHVPQRTQKIMGALPKGNCYTAMLTGTYDVDYGKKKNGEIKTTTFDKSMFNQEKYKFFLDAGFEISHKCCQCMKKDPVHKYAKETGRMPITAQMADESRLRTQQWIRNGCNGFHMKSPISNPLSFWTEQDILRYISENRLPICSVYGDVVEDYEAEGLMKGQVTFEDFRDDKIYKTTGCKRTGCMLCGFGCHIKGDTRFLQLKQTHEKMYNLLDVVKNNGVTFREAIEWTNEHGNLNIKL